MKKITTVGIVVFMLSASLLGMITITGPVSAANGNFGGGNGTASTPYLIEDVYDLQNMSANLSAYYALANDINATITRTWNGGAGFMPIGNLTAPFKGEFDGRGYSITGLYINRPNEDHVGLFGDVAYLGRVHDFNLKGANITGGNYTGSVAGHTSDANVTQLINVPTAPEAYWKMNESFWNGTAGEVKDSSGNGNDGTALNGANTTTGKYDRAGDFDGTDDYVETGKTATDLSINGANPRTIMLWVYTRAFNDGGVYECGTYTTDQDFSFRTTTTANTWRVQLWNDDMDFTYAALNTWVHFAIVYDGTYVIVYANGTEITRGGKTLNTADTNTFRIGVWDNTYFNGLIDELAIYDRALTQSEIAQSYFFHSADAIYNINAYGNISGSNHTGGLFGSMDCGINTHSLSFSGSVQGYRYVGGIAGTAGADIDHGTFTGNATATSMDVGGIAGFNYENITNCRAEGTIIGNQENAGGIAGGNTGTVASCTFAGNITASGYDTGGIVGENRGGTVDSCQAHADIESPYRTGGLVGTSWDGGTITNSRAYGNVSGTDMIGGLVGKSQDSIVDNCHAYSNVTGTGNMAGGLVGYSFSSTIQSSISRATVSGHDMVGGVVGMAESRSTITDSKSTAGTVQGNNYTAGVVGYASNSNITSCYSGSTIRGNTWVGGIAGYILDGNITDCYSMSEIRATDIAGGIAGELDSSNATRCYFTKPIDSPGTWGAVAGINGGSISSTFVDNETLAGYPYIGSGSTSGIIERNTTDLMNSATYTGGWDFSTVWWMTNGMTRPFLFSEFSTQIYDDHELQLLRLSAVSFTIHRDIYFSGNENWSMWGNSGSFLMIPIAYDVDGAGHYIHNLRMTGREGTYNWYYGFIGEVYGYVANLHLVNASIYISFLVRAIGGIMGYKTSGNIFSSSFEGNITYDIDVSGWGDSRTGGIIGLAYCGDSNSVNIYDSMFRGRINGQGYVGGLVGQFISPKYTGPNFISHITNSYVIGDIRNYAPENLLPSTGGLIGSYTTIGFGRLVIQNGYFAGTLEAYEGLVGSISSYYPDHPALPAVIYTYYHTSSTIDVFAGYPLTEDEMVHAASFRNWDFTGPWRIQENHTYPYLSWERNYPVHITSPDSLPNATQNAYYSVKFNSTDGNPTDVGPLWTLKTNADWLHISQNGTLYGTPGPYDVGTWWVNVTVADMRGSSDWRNMTLGVNNVNDAPVITTTDVTTATQDVLFSVTYNATDEDGDVLIWSLSTNATWLTLSGSTLSGTPTNADVGIYWVNISVSDGNGGVDWHNFTLTVRNVNDPPNITTDDVSTATQGVMYSVEYNATDPDEDSLIWSLRTNATWLNLSGSHLWGMPDNADVGTYWVNISVSDGHGGLDWHNFTLTAQNVNDPPVIHTKDVNTATQDVLYSVTYNATDPDGDSLTWALKTDAAWLTLSRSTISGTPNNADVGVYWVNISVSDGHGGTDSHNFTLTVQNVNDPPTITTSDVSTAMQDKLYGVYYSATDPDGDSLTWVLNTNAAWLSLNGSYLFGIPSNADVSVYWVNISVSDGHGGLAWHNFTITVLNVNDPPTITTEDLDTATQGVTYSVTYNATDPDGDSLIWSLKTNAIWLSLTGSTLSGTPSNADVGRYWVNISVSDGNGGIAWHNFTLTVLNVNDPPTVTTSDTTSAIQGVIYIVEYNATDPDGDSLTWTLKTNASWMTLAGSTIYGIPTNADVGIFWVNISVSDGHGGLAWHNFTLTVLNVNDPPVITTKDLDTGTQDVLYSVTYNATDPDGDSLIWILKTNALWLSLTGNTISGTPTNTDVGIYWVNISVSDGHGGVAWHNFTLTVENVNDAPVIGNFTVVNGTVNDSYSLLIPATDPDGNSLTWSVKGPSWLYINATTGLLTGTPPQAGNYTVTVRVTDGHGGTDNVSFIIHIAKSAKRNELSTGTYNPTDIVLPSILAFVLGIVMGTVPITAVKRKSKRAHVTGSKETGEKSKKVSVNDKNK